MKKSIPVITLFFFLGLAMIFLLTVSAGDHKILNSPANPVTSITSPSTGSWHNTDFPVQFSDIASSGTIISAQWRVVSSGTTTLTWTSRTVSGSTTLTVGPSSYARHQGVNIVTVFGKSTDSEGMTSATASRSFSIDWSEDPIASLIARNSYSGTLINPGTWTKDRDPYFSYAIDTDYRYAPISGYSWAINANPDPTPNLSGGDGGGLQLGFNSLSEGSQIFRIMAIDAAGNIGSVREFPFGVDYTGDIIESVVALTEQYGIVIPEATWQTDSNVWFEWSVPPSASPIVGYSWALNNTPNSTIDLVTTGVAVSIPEGETVFNVRAIDAAGNLGPVISYTVWMTSTVYTLEYLSGENGNLSSNNLQTVRAGDDGDPVHAYPDEGYQFVDWSDGKTDNPRTDMSVSSDISVTANFGLITGLDEVNVYGIRLYPNPVSDYLSIVVDNEILKDDMTYQLFDISGRMIEQDKILLHETKINMGRLTKSTYIIRIIVANKQIGIYKIEKQ